MVELLLRHMDTPKALKCSKKGCREAPEAVPKVVEEDSSRA